MNILEDQIRTRQINDDKALEEAFANIAGAIGGAALAAKLLDQRFAVKSALDEILKFYHLRPVDVPSEIKDVDAQIDYAMRPHGIMKREVVLSEGWYKDASGAMIGFKKDTGSVVALLPEFMRGYCFFDPDTGEKVYLNKNTQGLLDTEAIVFYRPYPQKEIGIKDIFTFAATSIRMSDLIMYALAVFFATLIGTLLPYLNNKLFSEVVNSGSYQLLIAIMIYMVCTVISVAMIGSIRGMLLSRIDTKISMSLEAATMMRILTMPPSFFNKFSSGELSSYADQLDSMGTLLVNVILDTSMTSIFSIIYIGTILEFAPSLMLPALAVVAATLVSTVVIALLRIKSNKRRMKSMAENSGLIYALISGIQKIKLSGAEKRAFAKWADSYSECAKITYDPPMFVKLSNVINTGITMVGTIVIYYMAVESKVSVADYYAFDTAYGMVSGAFIALASLASTIAEIKPSMDIAAPLMKTVPENAENKEIVQKVSGTIEIDHVSFRYSESTPVIIDDLSLKIRRGQYVAIVGETGCGKSTLLRLLLGFETPQKGNIYYDGKDMRKLDLRSLRQKIGVVTQNGRLFLGDIFANITVSAPWLTLNEAWEAAEIAGIAEDIRNMPMGMNTVIGEGTGGISGGQKQRLMIARAVVAKPRIIMLDEATSALDNITQKKVSKAMDELDCTRIVIAHRLSTIKQCNRIIVLQKGKIIEDGTYDALIAKGGYFAELVERQRVEG